MKFKTLNDMDLKDKKVLIRTGFDVPVDDDGNVLDDKRIKLSVPTIKYVLEQGAKQVILMWHMGRPKNGEEKLKTGKAAQVLAGLLGEKVTKIDDWGESGVPDDKIVVLENVRFNPGEKSKDEKERDKFGKGLASLAEIYIMDAFSNAHRDHGSMTSVSKFIPGCVGLSVEKEVSLITEALSDPERPFVSIIGGLKADKLNAVKNLISTVDKVLIGGALAFILLKAMGKNTGDSKIDDEGLKELSALVEEVKKSDKVVLPVDAVVADKFDKDANSKVVSIDEIEEGWMALDIGPSTVENYNSILKGAKTVIWNGPIGVFEMDKFANGTKEIAKTLSEIDAKVIIGGGDSAEAAKQCGIVDKVTLVSSGGGASLTLFEGKELVTVKALEENSKKF